MSDKERAEIKKEIISDIIKEWWPAICIVCGMVLFAITTTWWVATNIATTKDIEKVNSGVVTANQKIDVLNDSFNNHVQMGNTTKIQFKTSIDSIGGVVKDVQKRMGMRYSNVTQHRDRFGNITYTPVN